MLQAESMDALRPPDAVPGASEWPSAFRKLLEDRRVACTFVSPNPKRQRGLTGKSTARYDSYMGATDVSLFFDTQGLWNDLKYDVARGYCGRVQRS